MKVEDLQNNRGTNNIVPFVLLYSLSQYLPVSKFCLSLLDHICF